MHNETFEMAIKEIYKDIHLIHRFIETNLEIKDKLIQKYKNISEFILLSKIIIYRLKIMK